MAHEIHDADASHEGEILALHRRTFASFDGERYDLRIPDVREILRRGRNAIATVGGNVVGFCTGAAMRDVPSTMGADLKEMQHWLNWARVPQQRELLEILTQRNVTTYRNEFLRSTRAVLADDWLIEALAVDPEWRRRGIATSLAERSIEYARQRASETIFSTLHVATPGIVDLFEGKLGFSPMIEIERGYVDGTPGRFVGRRA